MRESTSGRFGTRGEEQGDRVVGRVEEFGPGVVGVTGSAGGDVVEVVIESPARSCGKDGRGEGRAVGLAAKRSGRKRSGCGRAVGGDVFIRAVADG